MGASENPKTVTLTAVMNVNSILNDPLLPRAGSGNSYSDPIVISILCDTVTYKIGNTTSTTGTITANNGDRIVLHTEDTSNESIVMENDSVEFKSGTNLLTYANGAYVISGQNNNDEQYYIHFNFTKDGTFYCIKWDPEVIVGGN